MVFLPCFPENFPVDGEVMSTFPIDMNIISTLMQVSLKSNFVPTESICKSSIKLDKMMDVFFERLENILGKRKMIWI